MYLATSTEVTLLLNLENLCTSCCLLFKSYFQHFVSFHSIFSLFKSNMMLMCCSLTSAIFLVCHTEQDITQQTHMQQTYSKQEMTQQTLLYIHPGVKYMLAAAVFISQSDQNLFDHTTHIWQGVQSKSSSLCSIWQPAVISYHLGPDTLLSNCSVISRSVFIP